MAIKLIKTPKFLHFSDKQCPFTQNFPKQLNIFLVPKVLRIIFYPYKHPSQGQKLKTFPNHHFFGTPCMIYNFQTSAGAHHYASTSVIRRLGDDHDVGHPV